MVTMSPSNTAHKAILASRGTGIRTAANSSALVAIRSIVPLTLVAPPYPTEEKLHETREYLMKTQRRVPEIDRPQGLG